MAQTKKDLDLIKLLNKVSGPLIEIGGPTKDGYDLVDFKKLNKKLLVFNLFPGNPVFIGPPGSELPTRMTYLGRVDFVADAFNLPISDNIVGAIFVAHFGGSHFKDLALKLGRKKFSSLSRKIGIPVPRIELPPEKITSLAREKTAMRQMAILEVWRVLEPGGLLVWQGGDKHDFRFATRNGFKALFPDATALSALYQNIYYNQVFRKIVSNGGKTP